MFLSCYEIAVFLILKISHVFLQVFEVACEDHGGWNFNHLQSHPRGLRELHLCADQWPADSACCLSYPHSDAYVKKICGCEYYIFLLGTRGTLYCNIFFFLSII